MFLNKMERKYGKYAIRNLSLYLVIGYVIGFIISTINPAMYELLQFDPYRIVHGQFWRVVTWLLTLPGSDNIIFMAIMLFFYYSIGQNLENTWGTFRYNVYIFSGVLFTVVGGIILYVVLLLIFNTTSSAVVFETLGFYNATELAQNASQGVVSAASYIGYGIGNYVSTYYVNMSIFLAFAVTYPDMEVLLYFIIPLKVKWLGYLYGAFIIYEAVVSGWGVRVMILASLLNFIIYFLMMRNYNKVSPREIKRKKEYRKSIYKAQQQATYENGARHKCAICGRTELDDPDLVFRYCSKCTGGKEYCQEHLFTHKHC